jgi:hypothetical protein
MFVPRPTGTTAHVVPQRIDVRRAASSVQPSQMQAGFVYWQCGAVQVSLFLDLLPQPWLYSSTLAIITHHPPSAPPPRGIPPSHRPQVLPRRIGVRRYPSIAAAAPSPLGCIKIRVSMCIVSLTDVVLTLTSCNL